MKTISSLFILVSTLFIASCGGTTKPVVPNGPNDPVTTAVATMSTSMGDITILLYGKDAPKTVANFVGLSNKNFYNGILFHRVVPGFVVQAGDPNTKDPSKQGTWGQGGESIYGGDFADELNPSTLSYKAGYVEGVVAMANRGPNTNTSQFFICLANTGLPHGYTIFGKVYQGMEVVKLMADAELNGSIPKIPIVIKSISIVQLEENK